MNKVLLAVVFALAIGSAACVASVTVAPTTFYGSATYLVGNIDDTIQDQNGNTYYAKCEGNVLFSGTFDECGGPADDYNNAALLSSDATSADLTCYFTDGFGTQRSYDYYQEHGAYVAFSAGFIQETCTALGPRPAAEPINVTAVNSDTPAKTEYQLPKNATYEDFVRRVYPMGRIAPKRVVLNQ